MNLNKKTVIPHACTKTAPILTSLADASHVCFQNTQMRQFLNMSMSVSKTNSQPLVIAIIR